MSKFLEELNKRILVMDGAMGTQLMDRGVRPEDCFDAQNLKNPRLVESVHKAYIDAGADIVETNTFGANRIKLVDYKFDNKAAEINIAAAKIARKAAGSNNFVLGSIGPLGKMLDPLGKITFDQAYEVFAEQARALAEGGVDAIIIETISDLQEMRAAVIAAKNNTRLPVIASLTYDDGEKTIYGTPPEAAVVVFEALGVDVISANCSIGPEGMLKVCRKLLAVSSKPIMVMPNAGMPELIGNKAVYKMTPEKFGKFAIQFAKLGVRIVGGCCGTGPEHIKAVRLTLTPNLSSRGRGVARSGGGRGGFASRTRVVKVEEGKVLLVGERINPTGRNLLKAEILAGKTQIIRREADEQTKAGASLLDVNISIADISEAAAMRAAVNVVQSTSNLPLSIDSPSLAGVESGLKNFCGRALLNSVNGKNESLEKVIPLAKKYGAAVIGLALDERGIPATVEERVRIAERIVRTAEAAGIAREDVYIDNLVMTVGVGIHGALDILKAISMIKERLGAKTILGISNVSHGMPNRSKLNALYLQLAITYGLDAAIVDPTDKEIQKVIKGSLRLVKAKKAEVREGLIKKFRAEVDKARRSGKPAEKKGEAALQEIRLTGYPDIRIAVTDGDVDLVEVLVKQALEKKYPPQKIIDQGLVPGMAVVGKKFNRKEYFLPQVIESAEAMSKGFELCKARIPKEKTRSAGKVLLATVKGDIHDIGKNIVKMLLENHGFEIIDLGKDVDPEEIVSVAKKAKPDVIALSALLTTTMVEMGIVNDELKKAKLDIPLLVGGAVVTKGYADRIGASYSLDAVGAAMLAKKIMKSVKK